MKHILFFLFHLLSFSILNAAPPLEVAIVGGGVAGCYSAYRLSDKNQNVALFEMSGRIGGRLYSINLPGIPHVAVELGAMRFLNSHQIIVDLARKLGITTAPFPMGNENNLFYLRNKHFRAKELKDPIVVPYNLTFQERGKTPDELLQYAFQLTIPSLTILKGANLFQVMRKVRIDGLPLHDYGYWNYLDRVLSREAYQFIMDAGGYSIPYRNWDVLTGIEGYLAAFASTEYLKLQQGFQQLPLKLADEFRKKNGKIFLHHELIQLEKQEDGLMRLLFDTNEGQKEIFAKKVILALPGVALQRVAQNSPLFHANEVMNLINGVVPLPLSKIFFGYEYPWWRALGLTSGRSVTDMEIRQVYYLGTENEQKNGNPANSNSLMLASYHDVVGGDYWTPMSKEKPFKGNVNPFSKESFIVPETLGNILTERIVKQVQLQLRDLHDLEFIPEPYTGVYVNWGIYPFGGAAYRWKDHLDVVTAIKRMRHPVPTVPVYICGETYAELQAWVEGALTSAELMLEEYFTLSRPDWLTSSYDLGI